MVQLNFRNITLVCLVLGLISPVVSDEAKPNNQCTTTKGFCKRDNPCCSSSGFCGSGFEYCGNSCIEDGNYKGKKCYPLPYCKDMTSNFSKDKIIKASEFKGDFTKFDFTSEGSGDYEVKNGELILKMKSKGAGIKIESTRFVNYGRISADVKTSRGKGVITAFITMSKGKDEIDFEWVGANLGEVQTNWFHLGKVPPREETHFKAHKIENTYDKFHNYAIDFNAERVQWFVDGNMVREFKKSGDEYPNEPARFSFGIWDGSAENEGTTEWAGGKIDWESEDMKKQGYYSASFKNFKVECSGSALSKDEDFDFDDKGGAKRKGEKEEKTSKDMQGGGDLGDEHMFDKDTSGDNENSVKTIDSRRPAGSSAISYSYSLLPVAMLALYNLN